MMNSLVRFIVLLYFCIPALCVWSQPMQYVEPAQGWSASLGEVGTSIPGIMENGFTGVFMHSGELFVQEADLVVPSRGMDFKLTRRYESQSIYSGPLGWGWDYSYHRRFLIMPNGDAIYFNGLGRRDVFVAIHAGGNAQAPITSYKSPKGIFVVLNKVADGTWTLVFRDLYCETYDTYGRLVKMSDRNNNEMQFLYAPSGLLNVVVDTMGRLYTFEYWPLEYDANGEMTTKSNRLKSVTDFSGRVVEYDYDQHGDLVSVQMGERTKLYTYLNPQTDDLRLMHNLSTIKDPMQ